MLFQPRQLPFLSTPSVVLSSPVVCWWFWKEPVCWRWDDNANLEMDRGTADAKRDHSWQPQPCRQSNTWWSLPPPCLVDVFLWQLFCRATFNSSVALGFEGICFTLPAWRPSSRAGTNLESFNEPGRVRLQPVLYDARNTENLGCLSSLKEHNFVIFRWISTKLCGKVYILPFNSLIVL